MHPVLLSALTDGTITPSHTTHYWKINLKLSPATYFDF